MGLVGEEGVVVVVVVVVRLVGMRSWGPAWWGWGVVGGGGGEKKQQHYHQNHQPIFPFGNSCARLHVSMQVVQVPLYPPKRYFSVFILAASSP